ncbi:hypothetical protein D3C78_865890 [compost metagenome]
MFELGDAFRKLRFPPFAVRFAEFEQLGFTAHGGGDIGIVLSHDESLRKDEFRQIVTLGLQPCHPRIQLIQTFGDDGEIGAGLGRVEAHDHIAGLHPVALVHQNFTDDTAARVLHLLAVGIHHQMAGGNHRAGKIGRRGPPADTTQQHNASGKTGKKMFADGVGHMAALINV